MEWKQTDGGDCITSRANAVDKMLIFNFGDLFILYSCGCDPGAYNSGKPGNLMEFVNSGKVRENSGNLKFTQGITRCVHNCQ